MIALAAYVEQAEYRLDAIGELELVDAEARRIIEAFGEPAGTVH